MSYLRSHHGGGGSRGGSMDGSGGDECCGGGATDVVSPTASPRPSALDGGPRNTPRTPWGAHDHDDSKLYRIRDGAPVMDAVGKAMRQRIRQLCTIQFGHSVMVKWSAQNKDSKNYITEMIYHEFRPASGHLVVSSMWIQHTAREVMSHRRSEARNAFRKGLPKLVWLDVEEWEMIRSEQQETPDRYRQQQDAAAIRLDAIGASHLGSGGYETMRHEFELAVGRPPTRVEEAYGYRYGLETLLQDLEGCSAIISLNNLL